MVDYSPKGQMTDQCVEIGNLGMKIYCTSDAFVVGAYSDNKCNTPMPMSSGATKKEQFGKCVKTIGGSSKQPPYHMLCKGDAPCVGLNAAYELKIAISMIALALVGSLF